MAKIIAKTRSGSEFIYSKNSAHKVSEKSAAAICKALNEHGFKLNDGEKWFVYDADYYTLNYTAAAYQEFKVYKNRIREYC